MLKPSCCCLSHPNTPALPPSPAPHPLSRPCSQPHTLLLLPSEHPEPSPQCHRYLVGPVRAEGTTQGKEAFGATRAGGSCHSLLQSHPAGRGAAGGMRHLGKMFTVRGSVLSGEVPVSRHRAGWVSPRCRTTRSSGHRALVPAVGAASPGSGGAPQVEGHSHWNGTAKHLGRVAPLCPLLQQCQACGPGGQRNPGRVTWSTQSCRTKRDTGQHNALDLWGDV